MSIVASLEELYLQGSDITALPVGLAVLRNLRLLCLMDTPAALNHAGDYRRTILTMLPGLLRLDFSGRARFW